MTTQEAFERSRPGQHALYYLFSSHDSSEDGEAQTIKLMHDGFRRQEVLIQEVQKSILDEFTALERRVLIVENTTAILKARDVREPIALTPGLWRGLSWLGALVTAQVTLLAWLGALPGG